MLIIGLAQARIWISYGSALGGVFEDPLEVPSGYRFLQLQETKAAKAPFCAVVNT